MKKERFAHQTIFLCNFRGSFECRNDLKFPSFFNLSLSHYQHQILRYALKSRDLIITENLLLCELQFIFKSVTYSEWLIIVFKSCIFESQLCQKIKSNNNQMFLFSIIARSLSRQCSLNSVVCPVQF